MGRPEPRRLVLVRHGRTAYNHTDRIQGQLDVPLDEEGVRQVARTAPAVASLAPSLLWSSDLGRARETADALAVACGLVPTIDARLREFFLGEREGLSYAEYENLDAAEFARFRTGRYDAALGSEKTLEVQRRMSEALGEMRGALAPGGTGVAVSHGAAIRVVTATLLGWPDDQYQCLRAVDNGGWVVLAEGRGGRDWQLAAYNRVPPPP